MTTTTKDRTFVDLDITLIDPDPHNETRSVGKDFINSIRSHGVIEPILVVPNPDNDKRYLLVAGERRVTGATRADLATIPAIVRHDLNEAARIEIQAIENLQRSDLAPCQEARQLMRLSTIGHSVAKLAKAVGRSQKFVRDRLRLVELPAAAQALVDAGEWSIESGLAALGLIDHPEALTELIEAKPRNVAYAVEQTLNNITFETDATALIEKARQDGLTVVERNGDTKHHTLTSLGIDETDHRNEPCHGVTLTGGGLRGKARLTAICTKPASHRTKGNSDLKSPTRPGITDEEREQRAAKKQSDQARFQAIETIATSKIPKTIVNELIADALIANAGAEPTKQTCRILRIEPDTTGGWDNHKLALDRYLEASPANKQRVALTIAMIEHDQHYKSGWGSAGYRWSQWLKARGWKPTAYDRSHIKTMRART